MKKIMIIIALLMTVSGVHAASELSKLNITTADGYHVERVFGDEYSSSAVFKSDDGGNLIQVPTQDIDSLPEDIKTLLGYNQQDFLDAISRRDAELSAAAPQSSSSSSSTPLAMPSSCGEQTGDQTLVTREKYCALSDKDLEQVVRIVSCGCQAKNPCVTFIDRENKEQVCNDLGSFLDDPWWRLEGLDDEKWDGRRYCCSLRGDNNRRYDIYEGDLEKIRSGVMAKFFAKVHYTKRCKDTEHCLYLHLDFGNGCAPMVEITDSLRASLFAPRVWEQIKRLEKKNV